MPLPTDRVTCARCRTELDGYGVLYGLCCSAVVDDTEVVLIFCYSNGCRDAALAGLAVVDVADGLCSVCRTVLPAASPGYALIAADLDPQTPDQVRRMTFCQINGHQRQVLDQQEAA